MVRLVTGVVLLAVAALPYTPLAAPLGFAPLPVWLLALLAGIIGAYILSAEFAKRVFYRHFGLR